MKSREEKEPFTTKLIIELTLVLSWCSERNPRTIIFEKSYQTGDGLKEQIKQRLSLSSALAPCELPPPAKKEGEFGKK